MLDGNTFLLIRQDAHGRTVLFESEDLTELASFIDEKEARRDLSDAVADGGAPWQDRLPDSIGGDN